MPGSIQVSIVGLMDLPTPETGTSSFTLKVAMGKREYQSMGQGDCSVPVLSIRDRLIVAIHDAEGNEIFQTEFRTISVVEKEVMEDSYPLKSGGYVNMKLQFLLSHEEHARIREMRESALKRKRVEQLQTEMKDSDSVQKKGNWIAYSATDEGGLLDQSPQTDPDTSASPGTTSSQVSEQPSEDSFKIDDGQLIERKENVKIQSPVDGANKWQVSAEVGFGPQFQTPRSLVSGDATEYRNPDPSELKENQENQTRSNVRKMVTAFESSKFQGKEPHFGPIMKSSLRMVGVEGSLKGVPSVEGDRDKLKVPQAISKSFSSGMLSDISLSRDSNDVGYEQCIAVNVALSQKVKLECAHMKEIHVPRKILGKSSRIIYPGSPNTYQQVSAHGATTKQNESECPGSHAEEEIMSAPPNGTADFLTYFGNDGCSLENHDVWTTRRLCLTTGTRQLRDLADCCMLYGRTHPIEKNSSIGSSYQMPDNDTSIEVDKNGKSSCTSVEPNPENSLGITKSYGGLVEQGVRIAILVVACGTLLFNTRQ